MRKRLLSLFMCALMESDAKASMAQTSQKLADILNVLNKAIEDSKSVDQERQVKVSQLQLMKLDSSLSANANNLVQYVEEAILPEFANFVDNGVQYQQNATYIQQSMDEFTRMTEELRGAVNEITSSIGTIARAIDDGAKGVAGAADSTQNLVVDMEKINSQMEENAEIAVLLQEGTDVFKKY